MKYGDKYSVIVLGSGETALGTIRSLHRAGLRVDYTAHRPDFASWSRYHRQHRDWPAGALGPGDLAEWLSSSDIERAVLMPCSDPWVVSVAALDDSTSERFPRWTSAPEVVGIFVDKNRFRAVLESLQIPHPRSFDLKSDNDIVRIPDTVFDSAFLKPHDSAAFFSAFGVKGFFADNKTDAISSARRAWDIGIGLLAQEYVPGPATNHVFIDGYRPSSGGPTHYLARRRLRMFPIDLGNSTDMVTIPLDSVSQAIDTLETLFGDTGYHGIFSAEFKFDPRDELYKILEVNVRPWWFIDFAERCGLHVCEAAYREALDMPVPEQKPYALGKRGTYPRYDWEAHRLSENYGVVYMARTIVAWMRSYQPVFSWLDPLPAIVSFLRLARGAILRRLPSRRSRASH